MRMKKQKRHRKAVRFYSACFGFHEPYKVLCDDTFVHHLLLYGLIPVVSYEKNSLGVLDLSAGGTPAIFLIINDGWQDITNDFQKEGEPYIEGSQYVYAWHALMGHWGGLELDALGTKKYNPKLLYPIQSPGNLTNSRDLSMDDGMQIYDVGLKWEVTGKMFSSIKLMTNTTYHELF